MTTMRPSPCVGHTFCTVKLALGSGAAPASTCSRCGTTNGVGVGWYDGLWGERPGDLVEQVGRAFGALQHGIALTIVVIDVHGAEVVLALHDEVDGCGVAFGIADGCGHTVGGIGAPVYAHDFFAWSEP